MVRNCKQASASSIETLNGIKIRDSGGRNMIEFKNSKKWLTKPVAKAEQDEGTCYCPGYQWAGAAPASYMTQMTADQLKQGGGWYQGGYGIGDTPKAGPDACPGTTRSTQKLCCLSECGCKKNGNYWKSSSAYNCGVDCYTLRTTPPCSYYTLNLGANAGQYVYESLGRAWWCKDNKCQKAGISSNRYDDWSSYTSVEPAFNTLCGMDPFATDCIGDSSNKYPSSTTCNTSLCPGKIGGQNCSNIGPSPLCPKCIQCCEPDCTRNPEYIQSSYGPGGLLT